MNTKFCKKVMSFALCGVMATGLLVVPANTVKAESTDTMKTETADIIYGDPTAGGTEHSINLQSFSLAETILWPGDSIGYTPYFEDGKIFGTPHMCHEQDCDYYRGTTDNYDKNVAQHVCNQGLNFTIVGDCATVTKQKISTLSPNKDEHPTAMEESQVEVDQKAVITGISPVKVELLDTSAISGMFDIECNKGWWSERYYLNTAYPVKIESLGTDHLNVNYDLDGGVLLENDKLPDKFYYSNTRYTIENDVEPVKLGYTFRWWDDEQQYGDKILEYKNKKYNTYLEKSVYNIAPLDGYKFDEAKKYVESGLKLTANWVESSMDVTFDANGGQFPFGETYTKYITYSEETGNDTTIMNQLPTKDGDEFLGWYIGDTQIVKLNDIPQSVWNANNEYTVTAKWKNGNHVHDWVESAEIPATCLVNGKTAVKKCSKCDAVEGGEVIKATGHKWDAGIVTKEATENAEGVKTYKCTNAGCSETKTEVIPKKEATTSGDTKPDDTKPGDTNPDDKNPVAPGKGEVVKDDKSDAQVKVLDSEKKAVAFIAPKNAKIKTITVPAKVTVNGVTYKVTKVDDGAFMGNTTVTKVVLPSSIVSIGKNAFSGCKKLKNITIKTTKLTAKNVGKNAFKGMPKKATMKVPEKQLKAYKKFMSKKGFKGKVKA